MRPRFFLPLLGTDEGGLLIGASTYGYDAFQEHVYSLAAGYGIGSGRPLLKFHYSGPLPGHRQAAWGFQVAQETLIDDDGSSGTLRRDLTLEAGYTWPGLLSGTTLWAQTRLSEEQRVRAVGPAAPQHPVQTASVGMSHLRDRPVDDRNVRLDTRLTLTGLREGAGWERRGYVATWQEAATLSWNLRRHMLDGTLTLGTSDLEDGFILGPSSAAPRALGDWSLNAPGRDLIGRHAVRLVVGLNNQLVRISRGIGVWPLFLDDIGGRLYVEGGAVWTDLDRAPASRWGVGAETSLTAYVGYHLPITVAVGAAVNLEQEERPFAVYLRLSLDDILGGAWRR